MNFERWAIDHSFVINISKRLPLSKKYESCTPIRFSRGVNVASVLPHLGFTSMATYVSLVFVNAPIIIVNVLGYSWFHSLRFSFEGGSADSNHLVVFQWLF